MKRLQLTGAKLQELRDQVYARSQSLCDACGVGIRPDGWHLHHRKRRSQGGPDTLANCVALHAPCHQRIHSGNRSVEHGWIIKSWQEPEDVRVWLHSQRWALPSVDGSWEAAND